MPHIAYGAYAGQLKQLILQLKYHGGQHLALELGQQLGHWYQQHWPAPDLLVPVPLHPERQRERGYNQAEALARGLGQVLGSKLQLAVQRVINTPALHSLGDKERQQVLAEAFALNPRSAKKIQGQRILLIDDILTTGTTLKQAACILLPHTQKLVSLSLARTMIADPLDFLDV